MRNIFQNFFPYALISPQHLERFAGRLLGVDPAKISRVDNSDGEDDPPEDDPWWKKKDIWGDPLPAPSIIGSTAVIPIKGIITSGLPTVFRAIGVVDTEEIAGWIKEAAAAPEISRLLLNFDSPGGIYTGTPELAEIVANVSKPVIAFTQGLMCSAAYWVASQSDILFCTRSAGVGSIGVYMVHYDWTGWLEQMGISAEMFKSGNLKGAGHPDIPLTDAQREQFQQEIDSIGTEFRATVKAKRSLVDDDSMRGQSFIGTEAAARNLVAGVRSFESLF